MVFATRNTRVVGTVVALALCAAWSGGGIARAQSVRTHTGNGADTELREDEDLQRGGAQDLNTRLEATPTNLEIIALRFDLTGFTPSQFVDSSLRVTVNRTGMPANNGLRYFGLNPGVAGQNWTEGTANQPWSSTTPFPGLIHDDDLSTFPINPAETTDLGTLSWTTAPAQGDLLTFTSPNLTTFLQGSGNLVTFFLFREVATGTQIRLGSKESSALGATGTQNPVVVHGLFSAELTFVPEPGAAALLSLGALTFLRRRVP